MKSSIILLFLILLVGVAPIAWMFATSVWSDEGLTLKHYAVLFRETRALMLLANTMALGLSTVAGALLLGVPLAFVLARTDLPFINMMNIVLLIPLFLPPYILAVAWNSVLGKRGMLHQLFGLGEPASALLNSLWGSAAVLALAFLPIAIVFVKTALAQVPLEIEAAARLEASRWQILRHITLPLMAPAMLSSGILIFVLAISEFAVPMFLGVQVFTAEIFTQFAAFYNMANSPENVTAAMSMILIVPILLAISLVILLSRFLFKENST